jgi:hypothetical protein
VPEDPNPRFFVLDRRGALWPISTVANGQPIGIVVNPEDVEPGEAVEEPSTVVLAFLDAINPAELERAALARLEMGDGEASPTRHILDVLKELATP